MTLCLPETVGTNPRAKKCNHVITVGYIPFSNKLPPERGAPLGGFQYGMGTERETHLVALMTNPSDSISGGSLWLISMLQLIIWLVVSTPLKNMKVGWDDYSQYMEE